MAKAKPDNSVKRVQNRHVYSRMAFLHQAAQHLASKRFLPESVTAATPRGEEVAVSLHRSGEQQKQPEDFTLSNTKEGISRIDASNQFTPLIPTDGFGLSRRLASHILSVSRKASVRASREIKRSVCKRCSSVLIPGQTAENRVENRSRRGHKHCADVMLVTCSACGFEKRYPFGAQRQPRKKDRVACGKIIAKDATRDPDQGDG